MKNKNKDKKTKIVQSEDVVLRLKAKPIQDEFFGSAKLKKIIKDMSQALAAEEDGVALAAPQIGLSWRLFIVSGKIFSQEDKAPTKDLVFINPIITKLSKKRSSLDEGCLSTRWWYGKTRRSDKAAVEAFDENGKKFRWNGAGLMAQIFQHEIDHLEGVLFTDHAKDLTEIPPEKYS